MAREFDIHEKTRTVFEFTIKDSFGAIIDVTGFAFRARMSSMYNPETPADLATKTTDSGIVLTDPTNGKIQATFDATDLTVDRDIAARVELVLYSGGSLTGNITDRAFKDGIIREALFE